MFDTQPKGPGAVLRQARSRLLESGDIPSELPVDAVVARSWRRSLRAGLMPAGRLPEVVHLSGAQLARLRERQQELLAHARPVMEYLYRQTRDSDSMVILADDRGLLLQAMGDSAFLSRAERVALAPGASWAERYRGTNAIGTALAEAEPVVINGPEHYLERNAFLTCAAAPVAAPDGTLLGVLDISGDHRRHHPHTFCLVRSAAQMIENGLFEARHGGNLQLRFHPLAEGIGTVAEGVLALSEDGYVIGANRAGLEILGLRPADLGAQHLERLLHVRLEDLLAWAYRRGSEIMPVQASRGGRLFVRVEAGRVLRMTAAAPVPAAAPTDALAALDTGCGHIRAAVTKARRVLDKAIPVLLQGESGVGKEVFAKAMHDSGPRREQAFVAVDCSALPENLIEAELFGYAPGAYTGARRTGSPGRIREADGGTLFLDEIGDMPLAMQSRLLRVLQERQVTPLGGGKPVAVDFALVCATHRNLKAEMEAGRFRADLYYRLNGLTLMLPALRERTDFPFLLDRLLADLAPGRRIGFETEVAGALADFAWPGNIRQLVNALRTACALLDERATRIGWAHLPDDLVEELRAPARCLRRAGGEAGEDLRSLSAVAIRRAVEASAGNMSEAARRLGISRNTLYRRLKRGGLA
ncbi:sigma-54-dependent Fis family transcriptional regulator [Parasulfuritortus cantonensis]|uniref:Sigma-54-dependent Fis family transcriptional regulator n=1 Tax=Parasulfuritortus cantonensis TaxID=2528202 RepID=A0A4R1BE12_9PROT|nr:sigma-54-dependent Fis family transcriptional regulator [Parasulfuritortus cantonensis]TCJ15375.1 sigma-54-dependent Fis family transcriptional regulator [Parasulfuritortus cantonensis]